MQTAKRNSGIGFFAALATFIVASCAHALPSQEVEVAVRYATEPTTGNMVAAAIVVLASIRRKKFRKR